MKYERGYKSEDVEIRDGETRQQRGVGGGGGLGLVGNLLPWVFSRFGIGGVVVAVGGFFLFNYFAGKADTGAAGGTADGTPAATRSDPRVEFVSFVLDDVQASWAKRFEAQGKRYQRAKLIIFRGGTSTGCGYGESATGPFYCSVDHDVYLDLDFFKTLSVKLGAQGDFAQAYVVAHEIGHHVQNQLGLTDSARASASSQKGADGSSVHIELQADCFAGIWAHDTAKRNLLEGGDLEEALTAAKSIGDDRLQNMGTGVVQPEKWTHGSSAQRMQWFKRGYDTGDFKACDTSH